mgnify:CR=1 FL=1
MCRGREGGEREKRERESGGGLLLSFLCHLLLPVSLFLSFSRSLALSLSLLQRHRDELVRATAVETRASIAASAFTSAIDRRKSQAVDISLQRVVDSAEALLLVDDNGKGRRRGTGLGDAVGTSPRDRDGGKKGRRELNFSRSASHNAGGGGGGSGGPSSSSTPTSISSPGPVVVDCIKQRRLRGDLYRTVVVATPPVTLRYDSTYAEDAGGGGVGALAAEIQSRSAAAYVATLDTATRRETNKWSATALRAVDVDRSVEPPVIVLTVAAAGRAAGDRRSVSFNNGESSIRLVPLRTVQGSALVDALRTVARAGADERERLRRNRISTKGMRRTQSARHWSR